MMLNETKSAIAALLGALLVAAPAFENSRYLVSPDGKYLGNLNANACSHQPERKAEA